MTTPRTTQARGRHPTSTNDGERAHAPTAVMVWLLAGCLALVALSAYHNSFAGQFVFDDHGHIVLNQRIQQPWPPWSLLSTRRPLVALSLALNHAISTLDPGSYHAFNLTIHILAGLTLFGLVRRTLLLGRNSLARPSRATWLAFVIAMLWLAHPLQTQSVTYIIQRAESMMALFYLLTLYCVVRGATSRCSGRWYVTAVVACALGAGSKAVIVTAPLVVLLYDRIFLAASVRELLRRRWALHAGIAATWLLLFWTGIVQAIFVPKTVGTHMGFGYDAITSADYAMSQTVVLLRYLGLSLWPAPLCLDYAWSAEQATSTVVAACFALIAALSCVAWMLAKRSRMGFAAAWFFLVLLPTSSIVPIRDVLFEHRVYLPLAGVVTLLVLGGHAVLRHIYVRAAVNRGTQHWISASVVAVSVLVLGASTIRRNSTYHSEAAMWRDVLRKRPGNARAHNSMGKLTLDQGNVETAIAWFQNAVALDPLYADAFYNLGTATIQLGKFDQSVAAFRSAVKLKASVHSAHIGLANALVASGRVNEAEAVLKNLIELAPKFPSAHVNLGNVFSLTGNLDAAATAYRTAIDLDPTLADARYNLGNVFSKQGKFDDAIAEYREAIRINPAHTSASVNMGNTFARLGRFDEAIRAYRNALAIDPNHAGARRSLQAALERQGQ